MCPMDTTGLCLIGDSSRAIHICSSGLGPVAVEWRGMRKQQVGAQWSGALTEQHAS